PLLFRTPPPPCSTLFPYTTLFRSCLVARTRGRLTGASGVLALLRRLRRLGINLGRGLDLGLLLTLVILGLRRLSLDLLRCLDLRSEEHTSELQSRFDLVCRLLPEK